MLALARPLLTRRRRRRLDRPRRWNTLNILVKYFFNRSIGPHHFELHVRAANIDHADNLTHRGLHPPPIGVLMSPPDAAEFLNPKPGARLDPHIADDVPVKPSCQSDAFMLCVGLLVGKLISKTSCPVMVLGL